MNHESSHASPRLLLLVLVLAPPLALAEGAPSRPVPSLAGLRVSFRLDARLSGPTYGGERWVSPPTFATAVQRGGVARVDVRVRGVDANGHAVDVAPEWTAGDPVMVTVTPGRPGEYTIAVSRAGASRLTLAARGVSKELLVEARDQDGGMRIEIDQRAGARREARSGAASARERSLAKSPAKARKARKGYAVGFDLGKRLRNALLDVDAEDVSRGVKDALARREPRLSAAELAAAATEIRMDARARAAEARARLAEENSKAGEVFLAANRTKDGVVALPSGLQYRVIQAGDGPRPGLGDTVVCHHRGTFIDGTLFDSSIERGRPTTFAVKRVIKGWSEALQRMPVGSKWQLFVPPSLAYGKRGGPRIGPNATLVFEVELLAIRERPRPVPATTPTSLVGEEDAPRAP